MRNLHYILSDKHGTGVLHLVREWKQLQIKECDYKNHCRFTLRCISKGIIPVSVTLKTTVKSEKARKTIRKVEKDLLKARIKSINTFLDNNNKQQDTCRCQLASLVTTTIMEECQSFRNKIREFRQSKLRDRQINEFHRLVEKQEGRLAHHTATGWGTMWALVITPTQAGVPSAQAQVLQSWAFPLTLSQEMQQIAAWVLELRATAPPLSRKV